MTFDEREALRHSFLTHPITIIPLSSGSFAMFHAGLSRRELMRVAPTLEELLAPQFEKFHKQLASVKREAEERRLAAQLKFEAAEVLEAELNKLSLSLPDLDLDI